MSGNSVGANALLMLEVRGEWPDWFELIESSSGVAIGRVGTFPGGPVVF